MSLISNSLNIAKSIDVGKNTNIKQARLNKDSNSSSNKNSFSDTMTSAEKSYENNKNDKKSLSSNTETTSTKKPSRDSYTEERNASSDVHKNKERTFLPKEKVKTPSPTNHLSEIEEKTLSQIEEKNIFKSLNEKMDKLGFKSEELVDPLTRRAAVQKFMKKMNEELGISPVDMVVAFSKLDVQELGLPPKETVNKVLQNLDINPADMGKAQALFQEMLKDSAASSMAEYLKGSGHRQISLEVLTKEQLSDQEIDKSITDMQKNFFAAAKAPSAKASIEGAQQSYKGEMSLASQETGVLGSDVQNLASLSSDNLKLESLSENKSPSVKTFDDLMGQLSLNMNSLKKENSIRTNVLEENSMTDMDIDSSSLTESLDVDTNLGSNLGEAEAGAGENADLDMESDSGIDSDVFSIGANSVKKSEGKTVVINNKVIEVSDADEASNTREIIQSAQTAIKNGGGEMKVRLNPDGLGEIGLKVSVENGKVNIEMLTENKELKQLVEKGLGDLKSTLASHRFDVHQIKVDVSQNTGNELSHQQSDDGRQAAQQFLQDFRQRNNSFREFFASSPMGVPGSQTDGDRPLEVDQLMQAKKNKNSSKRLDLVA